MAQIRIDKLQGAQGVDAFLALAAEVYRDRPWYVAAQRDWIETQLTGETPVSAYAEVQAFLATLDGKPVARVLAMHDYDTREGHLCHFDALPGSMEAVRELMDEACQWLDMRGARLARLAFRPGWDTPLTIDAYDARPTLSHRCNPAYYHALLANCRFTASRRMVEYQATFTPDLLERYRSAASGAKLRPFNFNRAARETHLFRSMINECFADHWGAPIHSVEEIEGWTTGLADLLFPNAILFAEVDNEPAGYVFSMPDLNTNPVTRGCLFDIGVLPEFRKRGIARALASASFLAMHEAGYREASYTLVLDDNWASRRTAESLGCEVARNFLCYERAFAD